MVSLFRGGAARVRLEFLRRSALQWLRQNSRRPVRLQEVRMVTAFVMVCAERSRIAELPQEILKFDGVTEVYSIAGDYDLVVVVRVARNEELAALVTEHLLRIQGITRTKTLIAFQQHSRYDLDRMFSIGMG